MPASDPVTGQENRTTLEKLMSFPVVFWVVQSFELMERGAYYVMVPLIAIHAQYNVGLTVGLAATLTAFMYPIQYGLPIVSGALAEKFGFKRQMLLGFIILFFAYLFLSFASSPLTMILAVMTIGLGIGTYKPLVSATVAKATAQKDRNLAYAVYYWTVNLAAAIFPILFTVLEWMDIITRDLYGLIFRIVAFFFLINIVVALLFFKEIPRTGQVKTVGDALKNVRIALSDKKFLVMVFLIGGFWALYSSMLNVLPLTLFNFHLVPFWFTPLILAIPNPLTIILVGPFLTKVLDRLESMIAVMTGVVFYVIGLGVIGFGGITLNWSLAIVGIVIASVGEFLVAPGYLSFVSKLASKEKVSAYIGANFLATMMGLVGGTIVFGSAYAVIGPELGRPKFFYGMLISLGLILLTGFMIYYKSWGQEIIQRAKRIREIEEGVSHEADPTDNPMSHMLRRIFGRRSTMLVAWILVPIVLFATFSMGTDIYYPPEEEEGGEKPVPFDPLQFDIASGDPIEESDYLNENSDIDIDFEFTPEDKEKLSKLKSVTAVVTWTDEPDQRRIRLFENQGDSFGIEIHYTADPGDPTTSNITESSGMVTNAHGMEGTVSLTVEVDHKIMKSHNGTGNWTVTVILGNCGDYEAVGLNLFPIEDSGNDFQVVIEYDYYVPKQ